MLILYDQKVLHYSDLLCWQLYLVLDNETQQVVSD